MPGAKRVERTLAPLEESGDPILLTEALHLVVPAREDLVRIALMADVPDELVGRRVERVVQRDRELHDAKPRPDVPSSSRADVDQALSNLASQYPQFVTAERPDIGRRLDALQNCHVRSLQRDTMGIQGGRRVNREPAVSVSAVATVRQTVGAVAAIDATGQRMDLY